MTTCPQGHQSGAEDYCEVCGTPVSAGPSPSAATPVAGGPAPSPAGSAPAAAAATGAPSCPHCSAQNVADALFCEACGYDFTTGTMPRPEASSIPTPTRPDEIEDAPSPRSAASGSAADDREGRGTAEDAAAGPSGPAPAAAAGAPAEHGAADARASTDPEWVAELWIDPDWYACQNSADPMPSPGLPEVVALRGRSLLVGRVSRSRNIHPDIDCESDSGVSRRQAQLTTDGTRWFVEDLESANGTFLGPASGPIPNDPIAPGQRTELGRDDRLYVGAWTRMVIRHAAPGEV